MYRELYDSVSEGAPKLENIAALSRLPMVSKSMLKASFPDKSTNSQLKNKRLYEISTSGTSDRIMVFHDEEKRNWDRAADLLLKHRTEGFGKVLTIPADDCYERCGLGDSQPAPLHMSLIDAMTERGQARAEARKEALSRLARTFLWRSYALPAPGVDGTNVEQRVIENYFDTINELAPITVKAFPYYFWMMSNRSNSGTFKNVRFIRPSGGKATPLMIDTIETRLGAKFRENYGTAELGTIAMDSGSSRAQNLFEHLYVLEFIRDGRPAVPGELAELVITDLRNQASPLIRYRVGDVGRIIAPEKQPQGDDMPLQFEVNGRLDETIVTTGGKHLSSDETIDFFIQHGLKYFRLIQKDDEHFLLETVTVPGDASALSKAFSVLLGQTVELGVRRVRRIAPESSGKYKLVTSTSFDRFHGRAA